MARILVTEEIAEGGLDRLRAAGHEVDVQLDLSAEICSTAVAGAHALIIRSATTGHRRGARRRRPTCSSSAAPASASTTSTSTPPPAVA